MKDKSGAAELTSKSYNIKRRMADCLIALRLTICYKQMSALNTVNLQYLFNSPGHGIRCRCQNEPRIESIGSNGSIESMFCTSSALALAPRQSTSPRAQPLRYGAETWPVPQPHWSADCCASISSLAQCTGYKGQSSLPLPCH